MCSLVKEEPTVEDVGLGKMVLLRQVGEWSCGMRWEKVSLNLAVGMDAVCSSCCFLEGAWTLPPWLKVFILYLLVHGNFSDEEHIDGLLSLRVSPQDCATITLKQAASGVCWGGEEEKSPGKVRGGSSLINADAWCGSRCSLKCKAVQLYSSTTFPLRKSSSLVEAINFSEAAGCSGMGLPFLSEKKAPYVVATSEF